MENNYHYTPYLRSYARDHRQHSTKPKYAFGASDCAMVKWRVIVFFANDR